MASYSEDISSVTCATERSQRCMVSLPFFKVAHDNHNSTALRIVPLFYTTKNWLILRIRTTPSCCQMSNIFTCLRSLCRCSIYGQGSDVLYMDSAQMFYGLGMHRHFTVSSTVFQEYCAEYQQISMNLCVRNLRLVPYARCRAYFKWLIVDLWRQSGIYP